jgi:hypothetical protein
MKKYFIILKFLGVTVEYPLYISHDSNSLCYEISHCDYTTTQSVINESFHELYQGEFQIELYSEHLMKALFDTFYELFYIMSSTTHAFISQNKMPSFYSIRQL